MAIARLAVALAELSLVLVEAPEPVEALALAEAPALAEALEGVLSYDDL